MMPRERVRAQRKTIVRILLFLLALLLGSLVAAIIVPLPNLKPYSPVVYDRHGKFMNAYLASDGQWRLRTSPDEIPERLKEIIIRKEDRFFYYHFGVNPFAIVRATVQNILAGQRNSGASTITMQVARMLEPKERTYGNKAIEIFRALQMELQYSKKEILELYLSLLPLGGNIEGLQSASLLYYQSPLQRLNTAQLLDLILIPGNPNRLRPDRHPGELMKRRLRFGAALHAEGFLTREDLLVIETTPAQRVRISPPKFAPHFSLRVLKRNPDADHLMSSLDMHTQRTVEQLLKNHLRPWRMLGVRNGAAVVIDNRTMEMIAYAGSEDFNDSLNFGQVDAVTAVRSPGSTLKPFLYALQMDAGTLTPKSRLLDVPYDNNGFVVENYDNTYSGWITAEEALRRSLNIPIIRLLQSAGVPALVEKLNVLGFRTVEAQKKQLGLSIIVGGCGVTLEELTNAYTVFPRNGRYSAVRYESSDTANAGEGLQIFSPSSMYMITDILSGIDRPDLPNNFESAKNLPSVAFKTGTSYGRRDAWCIGYSADYTIGVWIGNVTNIGAADLAGRKSATPLLIDIFNSLKHGKRTVILSPPQDIALRDVCAVSGKLPTEQCTHIVQDYYSVLRSLNEICTIDKEYFLSPDGTEHYCPSCIGKNYRTVVMQDYPAELLNFYRITGKRVRTVPKHHPLCERTIGGKGPTILSPSDGMTYLFSERSQRLTLSAASGSDVHELVWYVDNAYVGKKRIDEMLFLSLPGGKHAITCMDNKGRLSTVNIMITYL
jgi:penicillin-binding protein 1C